MQKINFDRDWLFHLETEDDPFSRFGLIKCENGRNFAAKVMEYPAWRRVDLPHDWGVELDFDPLCESLFGGKQISRMADTTHCPYGKTPGKAYPVGWYRKEFTLPEELADKRIYLCFEGICRDSIVWVNGSYMDQTASAYTQIKFDITDYLYFGQTNTVAVRADNTQTEGWWYDGAGIYRHAWLMCAQGVHTSEDDVFVNARTDGAVSVQAVVYNELPEEKACEISCEILSPEGEKVASAVCEKSLAPFSESEERFDFSIENPVLWDIEAPRLYRLILNTGGDVTEIPFGIRSVRFDAKNGFFLNDEPVKIKGACVHQDFAGVGTALPDTVQYQKIAKLKEMGANAYRSAHHPASPALLRACDELGMLVMDETRVFGSSPAALRQLETMVRRDRNHPSIILWSIGNEELAVQDQPKAFNIAKTMMRRVKALDPSRPITYGGNNAGQYEGANEAVEVRGVNYIHMIEENYLDEYHRQHPHQPIVVTEEASSVTTRGSYKDNFERGELTAYGDNTMEWGSTQEGWWRYNVKRPYLSGSFLWTGFDYRGEPSPFSDNISSSFGVLDTCGFPKDDFYYYRSWWQQDVVLHILPHWNHAEGEKVHIVVYSNCEETELFLNGRSLGKQRMQPCGSLHWEAAYEAGTLTAVGIKDGREYRASRTTAGEEYALVLTEETACPQEDGVRLVRVSVTDREGNLCPDARCDISFHVENGVMLGVGNGDPASRERDCFLDEPLTREIARRKEDAAKDIPIPFWQANREKCLPGFEDDYRIVWRYQQVQERTTEETITQTFHSDGTDEFIEFSGFASECEIYLNEECIGRVTEPQSYRPYRFDCRPRAGENVLRLECRAAESAPHGYCGSIRAGRLQKSLWHRRAYHGLAMAIVRVESGSRLTAEAEGLQGGSIRF